MLIWRKSRQTPKAYASSRVFAPRNITGVRGPCQTPRGLPQWSIAERCWSAAVRFFVGAGAGAWATSRQMGSMAEYSKAMAMLRAPLPASPQARDLIRYATLAPNGHNTQPSKFRERDGRIDISPDLARRTPVVDPDDHHLFISLGCAAESLALAAAAGGARRRNCL